MAKVEVIVNGVAYPCRPTMGAMLRFKRETGKEVTEITGDFSDMCAYLWCCVVSACRHDKIDFDYSLMDFADSLTPEDMTAWTNAIAAESVSKESGDGEKKRE